MFCRIKGGVGLNLTAANAVILTDPWSGSVVSLSQIVWNRYIFLCVFCLLNRWNPAVEDQAIDRVHRIGQTRNVFVYRMICRDSVEEKLLALQVFLFPCLPMVFTHCCYHRLFVFFIWKSNRKRNGACHRRQLVISQSITFLHQRLLRVRLHITPQCNRNKNWPQRISRPCLCENRTLYHWLENDESESQVQ